MPLVTSQTPGFRYPLPAGQDLSAVQYRTVETNASGAIVWTQGIGSPIDGVLQNRPALGEAADIVATGISKVTLGPAVGGDPDLPVPRGALLEANSPGLVRVAQPGSIVIGRAMTGGIFGHVITMLLYGSSHRMP